jgi:hypothetical protein
MGKEGVPVHSICIEQKPVLPTLRIPSIRGNRRCAQRHRTALVKKKIHVSVRHISKMKQSQAMPLLLRYFYMMIFLRWKYLVGERKTTIITIKKHGWFDTNPTGSSSPSTPSLINWRLHESPKWHSQNRNRLSSLISTYKKTSLFSSSS